MTSIQKIPILEKRKNSLECTCEKFQKNKSRKCFTVCEICSENKILRRISKPCRSTDSFECQ